MLHWIIDLVLLAILIICTLKGRKKGFISGLITVVALIVAIYAANIIAKTFSSDFSTMLDPFISGVVDKTADGSTQTGNTGDVKQMATDALRSIGVLRSAATNLAEDISKTIEEGGYVLRSAIVDKMCGIYAYVITAAVVFILIIILFAVIANLVNLDFKLPDMGSADSALGLVFGFAKGLIIVFAIAWLSRFTGMLLKEEVVNKTYLLKFFMDANPIIGIFGF